MMLTKKSYFRNSKTEALKQMRDWSDWVISKSDTAYEELAVDTRFGSTHVYIANGHDFDLPALVLLPGFRTTGLFWDLNNTIKLLTPHFRIYILDVIGQPGLSSLTIPYLKGEGFGVWLKEVLIELGIEKAAFVGASFGALLITKLAEVAPERIEQAVMVCPAGYTNVSFHPVRLFRLLWPVFFPSRPNVKWFLDKMVFTPQRNLPPDRMEKLIDFTNFILKNMVIKADAPSPASYAQFQNLKCPVSIIAGQEDQLFYYKRILKKAKKSLPHLHAFKLVENMGHGGEVEPQTFELMRELLLEQADLL